MATSVHDGHGGQEKPSRISQGSRDPALPHTRQDVVENAEAGSITEGGQDHRPAFLRIKSAGESGRHGFHPLHFFKIIWASSSRVSRAVNVLWPFVPASLAVYYTNTGSPSLRFALSYIAMVPCANLIGFAGQELARKMPHMLGILAETTCVLKTTTPLMLEL